MSLTAWFFSFSGGKAAEDVGIEGGPVRQRQDFAGARIFHHDRSCDRLRVLHPLIQFFLDDVLDRLVDGQHQILPGLGRLLDGAEPLAPGIDGDEFLAGNAAQIVVKLAFQPAQALVVSADIAEHMRRQLALGIKALRLLAKVNAAEIQLANAFRGVGVDLALDESEVAIRLQPGNDLLRIHVENFAEEYGRGLLIMNFAGDSEHRININRHRQRITVAIVDVAAARLYRDGAILLALRAQHEVAVLDDLQPHQPETDGEYPEKKQSSEDVEAFGWRLGCARPHSPLAPFRCRRRSVGRTAGRTCSILFLARTPGRDRLREQDRLTSYCMPEITEMLFAFAITGVA